MGDLTLFEALTGGAFDRLSWQHSGEFDQKFSKKSNAPGFARGGGGGMGGLGIDRYIIWPISRQKIPNTVQITCMLIWQKAPGVNRLKKAS